MRNDLAAAVGAAVVIGGFVVLFGGLTERIFGRHGPFDLRPVSTEQTHPDEIHPTVNVQALTFRGSDLITVRAYDGDMTPDLRVAPIPDSLNREVRSVSEGAPPPTFVTRDLPGLDYGLFRVDQATGDSAFIIRVTPDDARAARRLSSDSVTAQEMAERWRSTLDEAFQWIVDSLRLNPTAASGGP